MSKINIEVTNVSNNPTVHIQIEGSFTPHSMYACYASLMAAFSRTVGLPEEVLHEMFSIIKEGSTSMMLDLRHINDESEE